MASDDFSEQLNTDINEIKLVNVTLKKSDLSDPVLESLDFDLPTDEIVIVESSRSENASLFLKCLAGQAPLANGKILWNDENVFTFESAFDPRQSMGCYFENYLCRPSESVLSHLSQEIPEIQLEEIIDLFDLSEVCDLPFKKISYKYQKLSQLIKAAFGGIGTNKQILILEDPASGLDEEQWLCYLDFIQQQQRRGFLRHVFMTNNHPTALRHVSGHSLLIEDGLIYVEQETNYKKINHF